MTLDINCVIPWDKLHDRYMNENAFYKDKARGLLVDALGYEPSLEKSIDAELILRNSLQKIDDGHLSKDMFKTQVTILAETVSRMTSNHHALNT